MRVIKRDQKPDGKYVIINKRRTDASGSQRFVISAVRFAVLLEVASPLPPRHQQINLGGCHSLFELLNKNIPGELENNGDVFAIGAEVLPDCFLPRTAHVRERNGI